MDTPPAETLAQAEAVKAPLPSGMLSAYTRRPSSEGAMAGEEGDSHVSGGGGAALASGAKRAAARVQSASIFWRWRRVLVGSERGAVVLCGGFRHKISA
jgi:hypothetical protein